MQERGAAALARRALQDVNQQHSQNGNNKRQVVDIQQRTQSYVFFIFYFLFFWFQKSNMACTNKTKTKNKKTHKSDGFKFDSFDYN